MICLLVTTKKTERMTAKELADQFGITRQRVHEIILKQEVKRYISHLNDLMFEELFQDVVREMKSVLKILH